MTDGRPTANDRPDQIRAGRGIGPTTVVPLQFLVGGLVTFGGASFAFFAVNTLGNYLGVIHLAVGLIGLLAALLTLMSEAFWLRGFLIAINSVTIVYSSFSESVA